MDCGIRFNISLGKIRSSDHPMSKESNTDLFSYVPGREKNKITSYILGYHSLHNGSEEALCKGPHQDNEKRCLEKVSIQWRWHTKIISLGPLINPLQKCPEWVIPLYYLISKVSASTNWVPFNQLTIKRESWISQLIHITKTAGRSVTRANLLVHCTLLG